MGFKFEIDAENWIVTAVIHNLTSGNRLVTELQGRGFKKNLKCYLF